VPLVLVRPTPEDEALFAGDQWIAASADRLRAAREPLHDALVPIDGSALSASVLPHVARAVAPGTAVTLLMVIAALPGDADVAPAAEHHGARPPEEPANFADREARAWIERGRARLDDARERLEAAGVRNVDARLRGGTPQDVIVEFARRQRADLVAMATHGRSGLARTLLGSVPDHVLRHLAGTPILLVRPAAEPAPEA
jgi:nucleotide-binding universal stress UspA family protein